MKKQYAMVNENDGQVLFGVNIPDSWFDKIKWVGLRKNEAATIRVLEKKYNGKCVYRLHPVFLKSGIRQESCFFEESKKNPENVLSKSAV